MAAVSVLTIVLGLPGCSSLKEKRGRLKPLLNNLHRNFNLSVAEINAQDHWKEAVIGCAVISNDTHHNHAVFEAALQEMNRRFLDIELIDHTIESF